MTWSLLLILTPGLPAAMAAAAMIPAFKPAVMRLIWIAPLPALLAVALIPDGTSIVLTDVLLGLQLSMTGLSRIMLGFAALLWLLASVHSMAYLEPSSPRPRFRGIFLLVMAGNFGLLIARDLPGFYAFFAMMSLASYVLVVHDQTPKAYYAGAVYIVLAVVGETSLLVGMMLASVFAGSIDIETMRGALADGEPPVAILALFAVGFSIKMGLFPLHMWLPLAHPAAPAPASAVLSGTMIKAGLYGMITFLPFGLASWGFGGGTLIAIGLFTALYGVACGLAQDDAKAVLAYSSLSQMGVLTVGLGVGWIFPDVWPAILTALGVYMVHHGLTKGGLFLLVGARQKGAMTGTGRMVITVLALLGALAISGLPLTSGSLAKLALKGGVEDAVTPWAGTLVLAISASAVATTLLMARFLWVFAPWRAQLNHGKTDPGPSTLATVTMIGAAGLAVVAAQASVWSMSSPGAIAEAAAAYGIWHSGWPVAVAALIAVIVTAYNSRPGNRIPIPSIPQGDLLAIIIPPGRVTLASLLQSGEQSVRKTHAATASIERFSLALLFGSTNAPRRWSRSARLSFGQQAVMAAMVSVLAASLAAALLLG
jgi:hydrogenase-4 component B